MNYIILKAILLVVVSYLLAKYTNNLVQHIFTMIIIIMWELEALKNK